MANYLAFVDESGVLDTSSIAQPFFAVGFLRILDTSQIGELLTQRHYDLASGQREARRKLLANLSSQPRILSANELNSLLMSTSHHHEYKFTNITPLNIERYKAVIDTVFQFPIHFCALIIDKTDPLFDSTIYKNYWSAYITYTKLLCKNNCNKNDSVCVIADYMNRPRSANIFFETELKKLPNVFNALRAHSETFTLLQVCDLLLGSVVFQWRQKLAGASPKSNRGKAKEKFTHYISSKLQIAEEGRTPNYPLASAMTCTKPIYFSVWPLKLSNTKGGGV